MVHKVFSWIKIIGCVLLGMGVSACVEPIDFNVPTAEDQLVVEGYVSDSPGPYTVKVTEGISLSASSSVATPVRGLSITLYDDVGNAEDFMEMENGEYRTLGQMTGQVGRSYHIRIETPTGDILQSEPELLHPVGEVEEIKYEFEGRTEQKYGIEIPADVLNIFIDANAGTGNDVYVRWRYKGTYKAVTHPELFMVTSTSYTPYKAPRPCSGYVVAAFVPGGRLLKVDDCTCCECWGQHFEPMPQLSDVQLVANNQFRNVKVGEVPISSATFHDKYMVEVEQMSLSRTAFEFFKLVRSQKEGASNLFQPPAGEIRGNVHSVNGGKRVVGLFWATSISKKIRFLYPHDLPYPLPPLENLPSTEEELFFLFPDRAFFYYQQNVTRECAIFYPNATYQKPELWED